MAGNSIKKFLILLPILIIFASAAAFFGRGGFLHLYHLYQEKKEIEATNAMLRAKRDNLVKELKALKSDKRYLERIARQELGLIREGEVVYQFKDE